MENENIDTLRKLLCEKINEMSSAIRLQNSVMETAYNRYDKEHIIHHIKLLQKLLDTLRCSSG